MLVPASLGAMIVGANLAVPSRDWPVQRIA
jgi:hypothetical protein